MRRATWDPIFSLLHHYVCELGASDLGELDVEKFVSNLVKERDLERC